MQPTDPAFPAELPNETGEGTHNTHGMSLRTYAAIQAMNGLCAKDGSLGKTITTDMAIAYADALLERLRVEG